MRAQTAARLMRSCCASSAPETLSTERSAVRISASIVTIHSGPRPDSKFEVQGYVRGTGRMRECADGNEVHPGLGNLSDAGQVNPAAGFGFGAPLGLLNRHPQLHQV